MANVRYKDHTALSGAISGTDRFPMDEDAGGGNFQTRYASATQVQAWAQAGLAAVALSNSYDDLDDLPTLFSGAYADLSGKPTLGTAAALDVPATGNAATGEVVKGDDTRLADARTPTAHNQAWSTITGAPDTLAGFGITDAYPLTGNPSGFLTANQTITLTGHVTGSGATSISTTIGAGVVTNAMLAGSIAFSKLAIGGTADGSKFVADDGTFKSVPGGGDALTANPLSQFAGTTSAQLAGVITNETGFSTGAALVFSISPLLTTPQINDTSADHQYIFAVSELAGNRTVTLPLLAANDTFVFASHTQTLTGKTIVLADGSQGAPTARFASDTSSLGWYRSAQGWTYSHVNTTTLALAAEGIRLADVARISFANGNPASTNGDGAIVRAGVATLRISNDSTGAGNLILGTSAGAIGASGAGVLAFTLSTAPGAATDTAQLYSADVSAGDHRLYLRNEGVAGSPVVTQISTDVLTNKTLTSPTINGGTHTGVTSFGLRNAGTGAFDLTLAVSETLTAGRTLTLTVNDAARTISLSGNLTVSSGGATVSGTNTGDQDLSGYVPTTRTVNGHALSSNVTVTASDVGLGSVENTALSTWAGTSNITTLGTVATGTWNATVISLAKGGTGVALTDPNADRLMGWDDTDGAVVFITLGSGLTYTYATHTLSASGGGGSSPFDDGTAILKGSGDATKLLRIEVDGIATGTTRVWTAPDANTSIPVFGQTVTFTGPTAARSYALPDANETLAGLGQTQTWTGDQTFGSGVLRATSPRVTTGLLDANGNPLFRFTATGSALFGIDLTNAASGGTVTARATAPTQAASGIAGTPLTIGGSDAVAGASNAGAVAGGATNIVTGAGARLTSGNANGGDLNLAPAAGTGAGTRGQIVVTDSGNSAADVRMRFSTQGSTDGWAQFFGWAYVSGGSDVFGFIGTQFRMRTTSVFGFTSGGVGAVVDTGFARQAANVWRTTNGSTGAGSLVIGTSTVGSIGTSGVGVLAVANGTAPSSSPADEFQCYSADWNGAGTAAAHFRNEEGHVIKLARAATYTPSNVTTDRSFDADTVAIAELADVVGTLIADLQALGFLG